MAIRVKLPNQQIAEFPDGLPQEEITRAIQGMFGPGMREWPSPQMPASETNPTGYSIHGGEEPFLETAGKAYDSITHGYGELLDTIIGPPKRLLDMEAGHAMDRLSGMGVPYPEGWQPGENEAGQLAGLAIRHLDPTAYALSQTGETGAQFTRAVTDKLGTAVTDPLMMASFPGKAIAAFVPGMADAYIRGMGQMGTSLSQGDIPGAAAAGGGAIVDAGMLGLAGHGIKGKTPTPETFVEAALRGEDMKPLPDAVREAAAKAAESPHRERIHTQMRETFTNVPAAQMDVALWYMDKFAARIKEQGVDYYEKLEAPRKGPSDVKGLRGRTIWLEKGQRAIEAFENHDFSTVVHETTHTFRDLLPTKDLAVLEKWLGVEGGKWTKPHEEGLARAVEKYMQDGTAPTPELAGVFAKIKEWMADVYSKFGRVEGHPDYVPVTPEVRAYFDEVLGGRKEMPPTAPTQRPPRVPAGGLWRPVGGEVDQVFEALRQKREPLTQDDPSKGKVVDISGRPRVGSAIEAARSEGVPAAYARKVLMLHEQGQADAAALVNEVGTLTHREGISPYAALARLREQRRPMLDAYVTAVKVIDEIQEAPGAKVLPFPTPTEREPLGQPGMRQDRRGSRGGKHPLDAFGITEKFKNQLKEYLIDGRLFDHISPRDIRDNPEAQKAVAWAEQERKKQVAGGGLPEKAELQPDRDVMKSAAALRAYQEESAQKGRTQAATDIAKEKEGPDVLQGAATVAPPRLAQPPTPGGTPNQVGSLAKALRVRGISDADKLAKRAFEGDARAKELVAQLLGKDHPATKGLQETISTRPPVQSDVNVEKVAPLGKKEPLGQDDRRVANKPVSEDLRKMQRRAALRAQADELYEKEYLPLLKEEDAARATFDDQPIAKKREEAFQRYQALVKERESLGQDDVPLKQGLVDQDMQDFRALARHLIDGDVTRESAYDMAAKAILGNPQTRGLIDLYHKTGDTYRRPDNENMWASHPEVRALKERALAEDQETLRTAFTPDELALMRSRDFTDDMILRVAEEQRKPKTQRRFEGILQEKETADDPYLKEMNEASTKVWKDMTPTPLAERLARVTMKPEDAQAFRLLEDPRYKKWSESVEARRAAQLKSEADGLNPSEFLAIDRPLEEATANLEPDARDARIEDSAASEMRYGIRRRELDAMMARSRGGKETEPKLMDMIEERKPLSAPTIKPTPGRFGSDKEPLGQSDDPLSKKVFKGKGLHTPVHEAINTAIEVVKASGVGDVATAIRNATAGLLHVGATSATGPVSAFMAERRAARWEKEGRHREAAEERAAAKRFLYVSKHLPGLTVRNMGEALADSLEMIHLGKGSKGMKEKVDFLKAIGEKELAEKLEHFSNTNVEMGGRLDRVKKALMILNIFGDRTFNGAYLQAHLEAFQKQLGTKSLKETLSRVEASPELKRQLQWYMEEAGGEAFKTTWQLPFANEALKTFSARQTGNPMWNTAALLVQPFYKAMFANLVMGATELFPTPQLQGGHLKPSLGEFHMSKRVRNSFRHDALRQEIRALERRVEATKDPRSSEVRKWKKEISRKRSEMHTLEESRIYNIHTARARMMVGPVVMALGALYGFKMGDPEVEADQLPTERDTQGRVSKGRNFAGSMGEFFFPWYWGNYIGQYMRSHVDGKPFKYDTKEGKFRLLRNLGESLFGGSRYAMPSPAHDLLVELAEGFSKGQSLDTEYLKRLGVDAVANVGRMAGGGLPFGIARLTAEHKNPEERFTRRTDTVPGTFSAGEAPKEVGKAFIRGFQSRIPGWRQSLPKSPDWKNLDHSHSETPLKDALTGMRKETVGPISRFVNAHQGKISMSEILPKKTGDPAYDEIHLREWIKEVKPLLPLFDKIKGWEEDLQVGEVLSRFKDARADAQKAAQRAYKKEEGKLSPSVQRKKEREEKEKALRKRLRIMRRAAPASSPTSGRP